MRDPRVPEGVRCVVFAAKSSNDEKASIPAQIKDCREAIEEAGNRIIVGVYYDEAKSGWKRNRGEGLARAKDTAIRAAEKHGGCEMWFQHSDRPTRGDGITADHLAEVWFALRRRGVRLRSVQDDSNLEDAI